MFQQLEIWWYMVLREAKRLELAARCKITHSDGVRVVPNRNGSGTYKVQIGAQPSCQCPDFELRQQPCKHVIAARLVCERDFNGVPPVINTDVIPKRPTYRQNWPAYNEAQTQEKDRF